MLKPPLCFCISLSKKRALWNACKTSGNEDRADAGGDLGSDPALWGRLGVFELRWQRMNDKEIFHG